MTVISHFMENVKVMMYTVVNCYTGKAIKGEFLIHVTLECQDRLDIMYKLKI
jgi:hypothetical protein